MAGVTKVNGKYHTEDLVHRDLWFKTVDIGGGAISQDDMDTMMQEIHKTSTIEVIGTFEAGVSTAVNIVISGADVTALPDSVAAGIGGAAIADAAGW